MKKEESKNKTKVGNPSENKMIALCGVFMALAMILSYLESLVPVFIAVPGVKLGIANIVIMVALYKLGAKQALIISIGRILLSGILFGNLAMIIYSLTGSMLSLAVMVAFKKINIFSMAGVSVIGAITHNVGQIIVAAFLIENSKLFYYLPVLVISGTVSGVVVGIIAMNIIKKIRIF